MSLTFISEYNQTYQTHMSCYYCLELTLCYKEYKVTYKEYIFNYKEYIQYPVKYTYKLQYLDFHQVPGTSGQMVLF